MKAQNTPTIFLKPGREKPVMHLHPWIFSGAVGDVIGSPGAGDTVDVISSKGEKLGKAAYSPTSQIRARMWTWDSEEKIDEEFFAKKIQCAFDMRKSLISLEETDAYRLVHGESDGLPGLIADRYGDFLVVQILSMGVEKWRHEIIKILCEITGGQSIYERSDVEARLLEGLPERVGVVAGSPPPEGLIINENGLKFEVDIIHGQKTGFYLDQRENRQRVRKYVKGCNVLNCFCYTGAFTVYALAGKAREVLSVDSSADSIEQGKVNVELNRFPAEQVHWLEGDVFKVLRDFRDRGRSFDAIILDPPKFAPTAAQAKKAARGYKDINLLAFKLLNRGGLLITFSCSGGITEELFQKIVSDAALDARVNAVIIDRLHQGMDHPVGLNFPEGSYLKGLICRVE